MHFFTVERGFALYGLTHDEKFIRFGYSFIRFGYSSGDLFFKLMRG